MTSQDNNELKRLFDNITTMAESNPKVIEAFQGLITDLTEAGYVTPEDSPEGSSLSKSKSKRFSLNTLNPIAAKALEAFDFDGNGKVTVEEVQRGAEMLKDTQKKYKRVTCAMVIQFVVYAILAGVSLGVLYYYLYLMKDTTVDEETGNLMIKTKQGISNQEVSIKSHGETFSYDSFVDDSTTGESKGCVLGSNAASMFMLLSEGTQTKFMAENQESGDLEVTSLGNGKVSWTNTTVDLGEGFILYPDVDCTEKYLQSNLRGRKLSSRDLLNEHLNLRKQFLSAIKGTSETKNKKNYPYLHQRNRRLGMADGSTTEYTYSTVTDQTPSDHLASAAADMIAVFREMYGSVDPMVNVVYSVEYV